VVLSLSIIFVLFLLHGFLAMAELAILAARVSKLQTEAAEGDRKARIAIEILNQARHLLLTLQLLMTLAGVSATIYAASRFADKIEYYLIVYNLKQNHAHILAYFLIALSVSIAWVLLGEVIPNRVAYAFPEAILKKLAPFLLWLNRLLMPAVKILEFIGKPIYRMLPDARHALREVTEGEIRTLISQGSKVGIIEKGEEKIVAKVFRLGDKKAESIMTPRQSIVWLDVNDSIDKIWKEASESDYSYFPVAESSVENIIGFVSTKDISELVHNQKGSLRDIARAPLRIPSNTSVLRVLEQFKSEKNHFAIVIDEFGGIDGLITVHDIMEAIVGDLSEDKDIEPNYVRRNDGSYLVEASMDLNDLFTLLAIPIAINEEDAGYHSVGGFILKNLGHLPTVGENFDFADHNFEVVDMDRHRVDKVLVSKLPIVLKTV
jgi:putative hemolysin